MGPRESHVCKIHLEPSNNFCVLGCINSGHTPFVQKERFTFNFMERGLLFSPVNKTLSVTLRQ